MSGLFLCALLGAVPARAQVPSGVTHNPLAGSRVYGSMGCPACHSVRGYGGDDAPDLAAVHEPRSFYGLAAAVWNHLSRDLAGMKAAEGTGRRLDRDEAGDLIAFLYALGYFDREGDPERGRRLFEVKNCIECHQVGGRGGIVGPSLDYLRLFGSPIQVASAMWNHGPAMLEEQRARGIDRPTFQPSEFVDLVAYLEATSPGVPDRSLYVLPGLARQGRQLFRSKNCIQCHGRPGTGGGVGPDLASRSRGRGLLEFAAAMWNHQPAMLDEARTRDLEIPRLDPAEMADVIAYLYSVRYLPGAGSAAGGAAVIRRRGCLSCHALAGRGAGEAEDLSRAVGRDTPASVIAALWNHLPAAREDDTPPGAFEPLTEAEVADLAAYFESLGGGATP